MSKQSIAEFSATIVASVINAGCANAPHDDIENLSSFVVIQEKLPKLIIHQFTDKEHFTEKEFPELLELI